MAQYLTAAGLKLCLALAGHDPAYVATPEDCNMKFLMSQPHSDRWGRSPSQNPSCPDNNNTDSFCKPPGTRCIALLTYDIFDGTKGTSWLCMREMQVKWTEDGQWYWVESK